MKIAIKRRIQSFRPQIHRARRSFCSLKFPPTIAEVLHGSQSSTPFWKHSPSIQTPKSSSLPSKPISIRGWVRNTRMHSKNLAFVDISDGSSIQPLQVVIDFQKLKTETPSFGSCVLVEGKLQQSEGAKQRVELFADRFEVLGEGNPQLNPLQPKRQTIDFLRDHIHLRTRTNLFNHVFKLRNFATMALHSFFQKHQFIQVHTPILSSTDCEGAGETFQIITPSSSHSSSSHSSSSHSSSSQSSSSHSLSSINSPENSFFGKSAFLTVSGQLQAEALALSLGRVYTFGPTFRAEKQSHSSRHLAEFWMLEAEMPFFSLENTMELTEAMIQSVVKEALDEPSGLVSFFGQWVDPELSKRLESVVSHPFERIAYRKAIDFLIQNPHLLTGPVPSFGSDLSREHEQLLVQHMAQGRPLFVVDWPSSLKPFYMRRNDDGLTCAAIDLLLPRVGEVVGGSVREERENVLRENMGKAGLLASGDYDWYLQLRQVGSAPHAGFGLGFERLLQFLTGLQNIRDTIPFPRFPGSIKY